MGFAAGVQAGTALRAQKFAERQDVATKNAAMFKENQDTIDDLIKRATDFNQTQLDAGVDPQQALGTLSEFRNSVETLASQSSAFAPKFSPRIQKELIDTALLKFDAAVAGAASPDDIAKTKAGATLAGAEVIAEGTGRDRDDVLQAKGLLPAPEALSSPIGKLLSDRELAIEAFGQDSPQARILDAAIDEENNPEGKVTDNISLFKEFSKQSKDFVTAGAGVQKAFNAAEQDTNAGDIALIFGFFKTIDPESTVREGEAAAVQDVKGVDQQIIGLYNRLIDGERLTPKQRKDILRTTAGQFLSVVGEQENRRSVFRALADSQNLDSAAITQRLVSEELLQKARNIQAGGESAAEGGTASAATLTDADRAVLATPLDAMTKEQAASLTPAGKVELKRMIDAAKGVQNSNP